MTSPQKRKGDAAERAFVNWAQTWWPNCRRGKAGGEADLGDVFGIDDRDGDAWCVQVADRAWRSHGEIAAKCAETARQAARAGAPFWVMVAKRPGQTDVGQWWAWLPMWELVEITGARGLWSYRGEALHDLNDLACITLRSWAALVAPDAVEWPEVGA